MAISMNVALRNARGDQTATFAGAGSKLRVYTASYAAVLYESVLTMGTTAGGVLAATSAADATATGAGTAAIARWLKADGTTVVMEGLTVGTSGTNVVITNTTIAAGDVVQTSGFTITEGNP